MPVSSGTIGPATIAQELRHRAEALSDRAPSSAWIELAGRLYAIAEWLKATHRDARIEEAQLERARDRDAGLSAGAETRIAARRLLTRAHPRDWLDLFTCVMDALHGLDRDAADWHVLGVSLPPWTDLGGDEQRPWASGRVHHWARPAARLPALLRSSWRRGAEALGVARMPRRRALQVHQDLIWLGMRWERSPLRRAVRVGGGAPAYRSSLEVDAGALLDDGGFRIALAPLAGAHRPVFRLSADGFHVDRDDPFRGSQTLLDRIEEALTLAEAEPIHLLVLPELLVPPVGLKRLKAHLSDALYPLGVAAGSFHVWGDDHPLPYNALDLLIPGGDVLWTHRKRGRFSLPRSEFVSAAVHADGASPRAPDGDVPELIAHGDQVHFLDTSLGRVATLICADLIDRPEDGFRSIVDEIAPDLLVVVAMTPEHGLFERAADDLAAAGIATVVVNAAQVCPDDEPLAFIRLPYIELPESPPVKVSWTRKHRLRRWDFRLKQWTFMDETKGIRLLPRDAGLVLDLGAWWHLTG